MTKRAIVIVVTAALSASLAALVAMGLGGYWFYAGAPCSVTAKRTAEEFSHVVDSSVPAASNASVETYDCEDGSPPKVHYEVVDEAMFWEQVEAVMDCASDDGFEGRICIVEGAEFYVTTRYAIHAMPGE